LGKTALLALLSAEAAGRGIVTVEFELRGDVGAGAAVIGPLLDAVGRMAPLRRLRTLGDRLTAVKIGPAAIHLADQDEVTVTVAGLVADLATAAADAGRAVLVTVDEAHENPSTAAALVQGMHRAVQHQQPIAMVIAGLPGTARQVSHIVTYAERMHVTDLALLDRGGVDQAIRGPMADHGIAVDDAVVDAVADASGGYPYFVQLWGQALWDTTDDPARMTTTTLATAGPVVDDAVDRFFARRWDLLTDTQRGYVAALARRGGQATTRDLADALQRELTAVSSLRDGLIKSGIVYAPARGRLALTIPPMADWITNR
jgi:hypothetical protein